MGEFVGEFVFEGSVFTFTRNTHLVIDVRDDNGKFASISSVINDYSIRSSSSEDLFYSKAGYVETVYDAYGITKKGVRVEVVKVFFDGNVCYVPEEVIDGLFLNGVDWETRLMKMRRNLARKDAGYGQGLSIEERVESLGYKMVSLAPADKEDMGISAWNHSGNPRVAAKAKARKAKAPVDLSILGL